jgi:hypothetical protein
MSELHKQCDLFRPSAEARYTMPSHRDSRLLHQIQCLQLVARKCETPHSKPYTKQQHTRPPGVPKPRQRRRLARYQHQKAPYAAHADKT